MAVLVLVVLSSFALTAQPAVAQEQQDLPLIYPVKELQGDIISCASIEEREIAKQQINEEIHGNLQDIIIPGLVIPCGAPGWTLAASLNMTNPAQNCPTAWDERTESGKRLCFRQSSSSGSCDSVTYPTNGKEYTHVCGRAIGYQQRAPDAFLSALAGTIDNNYIDGLSVSYGQPGDRTHIWTFAVGLDEVIDDIYDEGICPCVDPDNIALVPSYVAANYFCESGVPYPESFFHVFYADDPLWDGDGCGTNIDCCSFNSPPWFTVQLPTPTTDDIEVRNCGNESTENEDVGIELIEFYIR